jgi:hypothetical protein
MSVTTTKERKMSLRYLNARIASVISAAIAVLLVASPAPAAAVNIVSNGSFEQSAFFIERPDVPRVADLSGSTPTGWTRDSGDLAEYMTRSPAYFGLTIYNPADGDYFIGVHDGEWWEQTFATVTGTQYELSYSSAYGAAWLSSAASYYRPGGSAPGLVTLTGTTTLFSGNLTGTTAAPSGTTLLDSPFVWSGNTGTFTADSDFTTLRLAGPSVFFGGFVFVDNVAVTAVAAAVPEPGSAWLLMFGIPAVCLASRRRPPGRPAADAKVVR